MKRRIIASFTCASLLWFCQAALASGAGSLSGITNYSMQRHQITREFPKSQQRLSHPNRTYSIVAPPVSPITEAHHNARPNTTTANGRQIIQSTLAGIKSKVETTGQRAYTAVQTLPQPPASGPAVPVLPALGSESYESGLTDPDSWVNKFNRQAAAPPTQTIEQP